MKVFYTKALALVDSAFVEKEGAFSGYAAASGNIDDGNDVFVKGAFEESLSKRTANKIRVLWNHMHNEPIGKTLTAFEDDSGLKVEGELLLDIPKAQQVRTLIKNDAIDGLSVGYTVDDFSYDGNVRVIKKATVYEYSFVTFVMNQNAIVTDIKSAKLETIKDCEQYLRDVCMLSRSESKTLISKIKSSRDDAIDLQALADSLQQLNKTLRGSHDYRT